MQPKEHTLPPEILEYYGLGLEPSRLRSGRSRLEYERTLRILARDLPQPPGIILDVGGGAGAYSFWLADRGYSVHLVDAVSLHAEEAKRLNSERRERQLASISVGDARRLKAEGDSMDAVLLLGPLYHLTQRSCRIAALCEARRVLKPGRLLFAALISRFASLISGFYEGQLNNSDFAELVREVLASGQHRNPTGQAEYFTTAYFHHPDEAAAELVEAGFQDIRLLGIEGPLWGRADISRQLDDEQTSSVIMKLLERVECEPSLIGASCHIMVIGRA